MKIKKLIAIVLTLIMIVGMIPTFNISVSATSRSQSEAVAWINSAVGKYWDYDGCYGAQCVDLIYYYYQYLGVSPQGGNAEAYSYNSLPNGWTRIPYYNGFVAQPGDIAVFLGPTQYGHIALVTSANASTMQVVDQNHSGSGNETAVSWSYGYGSCSFYGVIRPNFSNTSSLSTPTISFGASSYTKGDTVTVYWKASPSNSNLSHYWITVNAPNGSSYIDKGVGKDTSFSFSATSVGTYSVKVFATPVGSQSGEGSLTDTKTINVNEKQYNYDTIDFDRYYIRNKADGKYLNVDAGIDKDGTIIHTWQYENYHSQVFYIKPASDGYEIAPECSETRVVNPYGGNVESGLTVNLYSRTNDSSQWWKFQPSGDGYIIRNVQNPNVCLDASSSGMVVSNYSGSNSQIWYLEKLCTVSYNANGGSGAPSSHNARAGYKTTLSEQKPTKQCHTFLGWSTSKTATTASWNEKAAVTIYDNTTLYAVWKANHTYDNSCDASCNRCGSYRQVEHYWAPADCTNRATCYVCGAFMGNPLGHSYDNACDRMCNRCGGIRTVSDHVYSNSCDVYCNVCEYARTVTHRYQNTTTIKATTSKDGKIVKACSICGDVISTTTIKYAKIFTLSKTSYSYNGKIQKPTVTVKDSAGNTISSSNYTVSYSSGCKNVGSYTVTVTMKGNYSGTKELTYKINATDVNDCDISLSKTAYTYNGKVQKPTVTIKTASGIKLASTSYTVTYSSGCKNAGTYKVTITGKGNFTGTKTLTYKIKAESVANCKISLSKTSFTYNGKVQKPTVTIKTASGITLATSSYTVTYSSGCKNVGTYKVTIKGKGNFTGTKTLTYKINATDVNDCNISLSKTSFTYNGKVQKPTVTVKTASGTKLASTSYTVTYSSGCKNVGTYKVTIKGKGSFTGTKTVTFKIKPKAASVNTLTAGSKKLTVKLNRTLSQSTGYEIQYSTSKTFSKATTKTITNYKTSSTTLTGLKANTTYYVRVRTYKTVGNTKYYSNWSSYKYKKTK